MLGFRSTIWIALTSACVFAQPPHPGMGGPPGPGRPGDFAFLRAEFGLPGKVVTGAPYSAHASTQFTQTLADGTHIQRSSTASVARDSQGRTRTEQNFTSIGPLAASGSTSRTMIFINDPVAGMSYVLDPNAHTVREMQIHAPRQPPANRPAPPQSANVTTEDLGTQVIQGVNATGKRITRTIPAGAAGNDRAIQIVTETWTSPDLQIVVSSKTTDPRMGDNVYQLTGITRAEPDPALFTVPAGYTVVQGRGMRARRPPQ
ncbi:MAG TPA: hypothetical protein VKX49_11750 [Bryobacteraceae bacterium]|nr:hypothetical protein [Bryobacteraceae bacterium]